MKVKSSIVLDKRLKAKVMAMAKYHGQTFSGLVGVLLECWLDEIIPPVATHKARCAKDKA